MHKKRAVLLGANNQSMLTLAKLLCKRNVRVDVIDWQDSVIKYSSRVDKFYKLSDIEVNVEKFVNEFLKLLISNAYDFLIPVNDVALEVCIHFKNRIEKNVKIAGLPDNDSYEYCHNKYRLINICKEVGINYPKTLYIDSLNKLKEVLPTIEYPVILKPISSKLIYNNKLYSFNVKKIFDKETLIDEVREKINIIPMMIQEVIDGTGVGFNVLCKNGDVVMAYQHQRITEPLGGGASSYRCTIPIESYGLLDISSQLLKAIKWNTLGMLEYKISDDKPYIMELNGRYWGSVELGRAAGIDIPAAIIDEAIEQKKIENKIDFKLKYARNLFLDLKYIIENFKHTRSVTPFIKWLWSVGKSIIRKDVIEEFENFNFKMILGFFKFYLKKAILRFKNKYLLFSTKINPLPEDIPSGANIVFICYGNICRSPFAEYYAKDKLKGRWNFFSRGINKFENRLSPAKAVEAASQFEVDMEFHTSKYLTSEECQYFDIFIVMDKKNQQDLIDYYKISRDKIFFLSENEIADPFSKNLDVFVSTYTLIKTEIDKRFNEKEVLG